MDGLVKVIVAILIGAIGWDILTTYYGSLSTFVGFDFKNDIGDILGSATIAQHVVAGLFSIFIASFVLCYRIILDSEMVAVKVMMYVAFIYDYITSFFGTAKAVNADNVGAFAIVVFLSALATFSPVLLGMINENMKE